MTKYVFSMCILLTLVGPSMAWAQGACVGFLREALGANLGVTAEFLDPDMRFFVSRNDKIAAPTSQDVIPLRNAESTHARWVQNTNSRSLDPIFEALQLEGAFYSLHTSSLIGYLRSLSTPAMRQGQTVQFVFWEGRGAEIHNSTVVRGSLQSVNLVPGNPRAQARMETLDHFVLTLQETNATGEVLNTQVKVPLALTLEKYRTVSPPQNQQGEFINYHWGLLLGIQ